MGTVPLSHAVRGGINSSTEHLHALRTLVVDARVLQPQAGFTLMRAAIETPAGAVWLLKPPDRSTRVTRAFQQAATEAKGGDQAAREAGGVIITPLSDRIAGLQEVARATGLAESVINLRVSGDGTPEQKWSRITDEVARLTAAGAVALHTFAGHHVVMTDPEGNEFCIA